VDSSGNVYIADTGNNRILKETLSGGSYAQSSVVSSGLGSPWGVAVDAVGNVFVADAGNSRALKETPSGGTYIQSIIPTRTLYNPLGIAVDANENVYIVQTESGTTDVLKELPPTSAANFGTVNVGSVSSVVTLFFTFDTGGEIGKPAALTQGTAGLDFADAGSGSCTTNGTSNVYSATNICTVDITFKPNAAGVRYGAAVLQNSSGNTIGTAYIQGIGAGPQVNFLPSTQSTLSFSNVVSPYAIAEDAAGSLYIAEAVSAYSPQNAVVKETWTGSGYTQSTVATGLAYPVGVAVDGAGNVYIADQDASEVLKETPLSGGGYTQSAAFTGLGTVESVAMDGSGNVYISSLAYGLLKETLTAGGFSQSTVAGTVYAFGIAVDDQGNILPGR
jgi:NHL repeat